MVAGTCNTTQRWVLLPINLDTETWSISIDYSRIITKNKNLSSESLEIKGRIFEIKKFYEGISRFNFQELCNKNLGAEDYLEISKKSKFIIIEEIPSFNDINSNQQQRFITLIDIIYDLMNTNKNKNNRNSNNHSRCFEKGWWAALWGPLSPRSCKRHGRTCTNAAPTRTRCRTSVLLARIWRVLCLSVSHLA